MAELLMMSIWNKTETIQNRIKLLKTTRTFDYFDSIKALGVNGQIYGWDHIKIGVLEANKIKNKPNGPDVFHKLQITK